MTREHKGKLSDDTRGGVVQNGPKSSFGFSALGLRMTSSYYMGSRSVASRNMAPHATLLSIGKLE